ncbi:MAG: class I mannose-6-phosphate isomerase, partial [Eubacteriales bacterium]|nr:class I mannose-6-phosphate isomerase [Eubacteriales bacterium]
PFRLVPYFDSGIWGGQWIKKVCGLDKNRENFAWGFDGVPEENSIILKYGNVCFETPAINLVFCEPINLLGERVYARFGKEFPIRFDFLDTMEGGNLSLQVHPLTEYIQETFGMHYTQDESYYILDTKEDSAVYLGVKENIDKEKMIEDLKEAQETGKPFNVEKYINKIYAKKHDHFLIPAGTIHCSGKNTVVLEISATPYIFTFKLWDWGRLGPDGLPRPIHIQHGEKVINYKADTQWVYENLVNNIKPICEDKNYKEESTGLSNRHSIETRRHIFDDTVIHNTYGSVNMLNLVEGEEITIESINGEFEAFIIHYAETFIIPACIEQYKITPSGSSKGKKVTTIKAYIR